MAAPITPELQVPLTPPRLTRQANLLSSPFTPDDKLFNLPSTPIASGGELFPVTPPPSQSELVGLDSSIRLHQLKEEVGDLDSEAIQALDYFINSSFGDNVRSLCARIMNLPQLSVHELQMYNEVKDLVRSRANMARLTMPAQVVNRYGVVISNFTIDRFINLVNSPTNPYFVDRNLDDVYFFTMRDFYGTQGTGRSYMLTPSDDLSAFKEWLGIGCDNKACLHLTKATHIKAPFTRCIVKRLLTLVALYIMRRPDSKYNTVLQNNVLQQRRNADSHVKMFRYFGETFKILNQHHLDTNHRITLYNAQIRKHLCSYLEGKKTQRYKKRLVKAKRKLLMTPSSVSTVPTKVSRV
tara:strand:- start:8440 stop:9498 length:1059 start_codon:yes stop_codon:yes gene_type:complete